jgi:DNA polymerase/3'-5' exonuclease PolX
MKNKPSNAQIADVLEKIAALLEHQDANPHMVRAYRNGADRARGTDESLAEMVWGGDGEALQALPDIGEGLSQIITRFVKTGRSPILERLRGEVTPEKVFDQVPGIGEGLAVCAL